jgi:hypothetical protein
MHRSKLIMPQPDPRKEAKSQNETSGKQQNLSNDDTGHSTNISENPDKSKKGEGVAETAKVKGAVSPDRPAVSRTESSHVVVLKLTTYQAENKEERGKEAQDKSK